MGCNSRPQSYYSTIYLGSNATDSGTGAGVIIKCWPARGRPTARLNRYFGAVPDVGKRLTHIMSFDAQKRALDNNAKEIEHERICTGASHVTAIEKIESHVPTSPRFSA